MLSSVDSEVPDAAPDQEAVMAANGIVRVPVDYFHWNGYRYSTLKDALAAAKRGRIEDEADA